MEVEITKTVDAVTALSRTAEILRFAAEQAEELAATSDFYLICILQAITASPDWVLLRGDTPDVIFRASNCGAISIASSSLDNIHLVATTPPYEDLTNVDQVEAALARFLGKGQR